MASKDDYDLQSVRIRRAVQILCPSCTVTFDSERAPKWIKFRIDQGSVLLTKVHPDFHVSEVADWSDDELNRKLESVTGRLVRQ